MLKKTSAIVLAAASVVAVSSAFATSGAVEPSFTPSVFVNLDAGWGKTGLSTSNYSFSPVGPLVVKNKTTGFAGGGDLGYQFAPNFGVDVGFYYFPTVKAVVNTATPN